MEGSGYTHSIFSLCEGPESGMCVGGDAGRIGAQWGAGRWAFGAYLGVGERAEPLCGLVMGMRTEWMPWASPCPGRGESHVATGACTRGENIALGGGQKLFLASEPYTRKRVGEDLNSLRVAFAIILYRCG